MISITVGRRKTALSQIDLLIVRAVADAIINDRRATRDRPAGMAPQYVPAGLGVDAPARGQADTSGSDLIAKLRKAEQDALITSSPRDLARVQTWLSNLSAGDAPSTLTREGLQGQIAALKSEYRALEAELERTPGETERLWDQVKAAEGRITGEEAPLRLARLRLVADTWRSRLSQRVEREQRYKVAGKELKRLMTQHAATCDRKRKRTRERLPDPVYLVRIPEARVSTALEAWTIQAQRIELDLRASVRTERQEAALRRAVGTSAQPVTDHREGLRWAPGLADEAREAWQALAETVKGQMAGVREE